MMHESFSTIRAWTDESGEDDYALQCSYTSGDSRTTSSQAFGCTGNVSKEDANNLLERRLSEFYPLDDEAQRFISRSGDRTLFVSSLNSAVELRISKDVANNEIFVLSAVVHKLTIVTQKRQKHQLKGSYSLMTKMLKHNTAMQQRRNASDWSSDHKESRIDTYGDGVFVLFSNLGTSVLSDKLKMNLVLNEFILKASIIREDFAQTQGSIKTNLRRRRILTKAYNKTML